MSASLKRFAPPLELQYQASRRNALAEINTQSFWLVALLVMLFSWWDRYVDPVNWRVAFMNDRYAIANRHTIGIDNMMWSTDYPHHGCDWPETRRVVDGAFLGVPDEERNKLCALNAAKLYGLS